MLRQEAACRRAGTPHNAARSPVPRAPRSRAHKNHTLLELPAVQPGGADACWLNRETDWGVGSLAILSISTGFLFLLPVIPLDWDFSPIDMHV